MRPSRLLTPGNAPQAIYWAPLRGDEAAVVDEVVAAIRLSVAEEHVSDAIGDFQALIERAGNCTAVDPGDVVPVARDEHLWELRLDDHATGVHIRIYIAEVPELPDTIVALHAHAKRVVGTDAQVKQWQDEEISEAMLRFMAGRNSLWGLR